MSKLDLDELLKLAEAATPGPWRLDSDDDRIIQTNHITRDIWHIPKSQSDMIFIAAANPQTISRLVRAYQLVSSSAQGVVNPFQNSNDDEQYGQGPGTLLFNIRKLVIALTEAQDILEGKYD